MRFVLASSSPSRFSTLSSAGIRPEVVRPNVNEDDYSAATPGELTLTLARVKAAQVAGSLNITGPTIVVGCDSLLEFNGQAQGKPETADHAIICWYRMRGRSGVLHTGHHVVLLTPDGRKESSRLGSTIVRFADLTDAEIAAYAATGEPERVAGGFTIDRLGGAFITRIEGDPHNVVGLSLPLLRQMVLDLGVPWHTLWRRPGE